MIATRYLTVRVKIKVPDNSENQNELIEDMLNDCHYSFRESPDYENLGCVIEDTEIVSCSESSNDN